MIGALVLAAPAAAQSVPGKAESDDDEAGADSGDPAAPAEPKPDPRGLAEDPPREGPVRIGGQPSTGSRLGWVFLPGVAYTPEKKLTVAGAALRYFRLGPHPDSRLSRINNQLSVSLRGRGEVLSEPNVWLMDDQLNLVAGAKLSYFDYDFYGIGNDSQVADHETYTAFRGEARLEVVARVFSRMYAGPLYDFRYEDITEVEEDGMLALGTLPGAGGSVVSGVGGLVRWDSRDNMYGPTSGGVVTISPRFYRQGLGSDSDFVRVPLDASWFVGLGGQHVLAADGRIDLRGGDPPFDHMSNAGGGRLLRGMIDGRFRDMHYVGAQLEYRFPLFWRLGGVVFGGLGRVAHEIAELELADLKWAAGGGARYTLNRAERIKLRFDVGFTAEDYNFYFGILEAF